ncbi:major facilitator superfamily domain-containing protein [Tricladium varicosporioides]|nr:major facilitator superfamily domain-containing protein [Hymenoscyphus varicosporioides]
MASRSAIPPLDSQAPTPRLSHSSISSPEVTSDIFEPKSKTEPERRFDTSTNLEKGPSTDSLPESESNAGNPVKEPAYPINENHDIVEFEGSTDLLRPTNWPLRKKIVTTVLYGLTTGASSWASSIYTSGTEEISSEFGVGRVAGTLGLTLFMFGLGLGPLLWAPLSEAYGRKIAVLPPFFVGACFCFGTATAKDIQTVMITRFFTAFFGSAPVTNTGGVLGDIWSPQERGVAILGYSIAVVGGALFSPIAGAAIVESSLGWRGVFYITGIVQMVVLFSGIMLLDETSVPIILTRKASRLRRETGNWALHSKHEEVGLNLSNLYEKYLIRPWQLFATPICFFMVIYGSFVYGIVYLNFAAFAIEFGEIRGWSPVPASLPFLAIFVGILFGMAFIIYNQRYYMAQFKANDNKAVPEARLRSMMIGGISLVLGLFIFGWTSGPKVPWIAPCIGGVLMGFAFFSIFQASTNYLVDTFQMYAASAMAANTLMRSVFAGAFPLFTNQMFQKLGVNWGASLLGFVALAMVPIPFVFSRYGKRIRAKGEWSRGSTL